jgi:hypothetical protein
MILYLLVVLTAAAEKSVLRPRVVTEARFVIVKYAVARDPPQVGLNLVEEVADVCGAHLRPAPLNVGGTAHSNPVTPPPPEIPDPHPARAVIQPPRLDIVFDTIGLDKVLKAINILGKEVVLVPLKITNRKISIT